jgi:hypothetical protein
MASNSLPATPARYTQTAIALHWLIAVLIVGGFALGWVMTDIPGFTPAKLKYYSWHKWIGVTVFALALMRLLWRDPRGARAARRYARLAARRVARRPPAAIRADARDPRHRLSVQLRVEHPGRLPRHRAAAAPDRPRSGAEGDAEDAPRDVELHSACAGVAARAGGAQASGAGPRRAAVAHASFAK